MSNPFYTASGTPATGSQGASAPVRSEFSAVQAGFDLLNTKLSVASGKLLTASNTLTLAGVDGKTLTINNNLTLAGTDGATLTIGAGGTLAASAFTDTTNAANISSGTLPNARLSAVPNSALANSSLTIGSTAVSLGGTASTIAGLTLTAPVIATISNTGTLTLPTATDTLVGRATTDTLTNKTISGASNTLSNIANGSLSNSSITIAGHAVALGGSQTLAASDLTNGVSGSGAVVLASNATLIAPTLGVAAATSINFGGTALSHYDEGTWTPADASGGGVTYANVTATYTRFGRMVLAYAAYTVNATANGAANLVGGLPFTANNIANGSFPAARIITDAATNADSAVVNPGTTQFQIVNQANTNAATNAQMSTHYVRAWLIYYI